MLHTVIFLLFILNLLKVLFLRPPIVIQTNFDMKKLLLLWSVLAVAAQTTAQHLSYDDFACDSLVQLGTAPTCPTTVFTNVGATNSNIGFDNSPSCFNGGIATHDVWFSFVCSDTLLDYRITLTGVGTNSIENPQFAVYRGDCAFDGFAELLCAIAEVGENSLHLDLQGLTPGLTYFIRVSDYSITATPNWGDFTLCVDKIPPIVTIDQGGSTLCSGTLYDSGGPDNDYGPDEDNSFVICPSQPSACIKFTLDYYNIESDADVLNFYDGATATGEPIGVVAGGDGNNYGGVCYSVQAASGCMTVQFQSDNDIEFEGWQGHWQCSTDPCPAPDNISLNPDINQDSIAAFVATPFTTVNVTGVKCADGGYATFSYPSDNNDLQMNKGLVLTSGLAADAVGPSSNFVGNMLGEPGDADLDTLSSQAGIFLASQDACVVEVDVFAATDELSFEYVFGSEEYPEFVNTQFNDIFAFLISGPGITGDPALGGAKNIATLPGTNTPVEINSVNFEQNWQYYRDYSIGQELVYDGLTSDSLGVKKSLTARSKVTPCNTYHLKFAIADRSDDNYDSGVFISKIQGGGPALTINFASGINYFIESCTGAQDVLVVKLTEPKPVATSYSIAISGTATLGVDYLLDIPNVITFQPGQTELSFPITPIGDNIPEGSETIIIAISSNFGCGTVTFSTLTVNLNDNVEVQVSGGDTLLVCAGGTLQLHAIGAQSYFWTPPGAVSNPFIANPTITPTQDTWLELTGTVGTCVDKDSAYVKIISPEITATVLGSPNICLGGSVPLQSTNNVNNAGLLWTPAAGLSDKFDPNPIASPTETTNYQVKVTIAGCTVTDDVTITVDTLFFPTLIHDTTVCQNYPVQLGEVLNSTTKYSWTPTAGLSDPTSSGPIALPDQTTTYTLTATSATGACSQVGSVTVTVTPANVDIVGADYREICLGDTITLDAQTQPAGTINWTPSFYVSSPTGTSVTTSPDESVTIFATTNLNGCLVRDSVHIRVDSLPNSAIFLSPDKPTYCPGDTIFLLSKIFEPASFPDLMPEWISGGGDVTPLDLWNLVIYATTTKVFTRKIENRGCSTKDSITVKVGTVPTLTITAAPPSICPGESSQLTVTVDPVQKLKWQMDASLSCTDCANPIATPLTTTTYMVTTPDADCPSGESITVAVLPTPTLILPTNPTVCPGGSILLNSGPTEPGTTYTWTSVPAGFTASEANPTVMPTVTTTYKVVAQGPQCSSTREVEVVVANATLDAGPDQNVCFGQNVTLQAITTGTPGTLTWQPGGQTTDSIQVRPPAGASTYTVQLMYGNNCVLTDAVQITAAPTPTISAINGTPPPNDSLCLGTPIVLKVTKTPSTAILSWTQNDETIANATGDSLLITPNGETVEFRVIATLGNCKVVSDPLVYNFMRCFDMPNAFTPNGDNINSTFGPVFYGANTEVVSFTVYNRWGQKVFESTGSQSNWDGRTDGKEAPSDVYAYVIQVRYAGGEMDTRHGQVTLLR